MWQRKMSGLTKNERISSLAKRKCLDFLFEYETPKVVKVYSTRLGAINRTVQFLVIGYIIGYVFIYSKGYQSFENAESNTVAKVKGMVKANFSPSTGANNIWDATDMVIPSVENDATFITTNFIQTPSQQSGKCPEDTSVNSAKCVNDSNCTAGEAIALGNGFKTGICDQSTRTCEIQGWCPTENDVRPEPPIFMESANFTILVKNYIAFPEFNVKRRNIPDDMTTRNIATCRYHPTDQKYCPIFVVKDLVELAGENFSEVARSGAIFSFIIKWECNLDYSEEYCLPEYRFRRMDSPKEKIAKGWNFRHADYWNAPDGTRRRTLYKYYGIRFVFMVYGKAGRFSPEDFAMNLGSGIGLFAISTFLCDLLTDFLLKTTTFRTSKTERIRDDRVRRGVPDLHEMLQNHAEGATVDQHRRSESDPDEEDFHLTENEEESDRRSPNTRKDFMTFNGNHDQPDETLLSEEALVTPVKFQKTIETNL